MKTKIAIAAGIVFYLLSLLILGAEMAEEVLPILIIFGVILSGAAWLATRQLTVEPIPVKAPSKELAAVLVLTVLLALWLCFGLKPAGGDPRLASAIKLGQKLLVFVIIPAAVFRFGFGYRLSDYGLSLKTLFALRGRAGIAALALVLLVGAINLVIGNGAAPIRDGSLSGLPLILGLILCFLWNLAETGLVEEFFFRALMQTRLAAFLKSETAGAVTMMVVFGLFHAPGLVLRGAGVIEGLGSAPTPLQAAAYCLAVMGVAALPFAVLWARSRNLWIVILVHAANDTVAQVPDFVRIWGLS